MPRVEAEPLILRLKSPFRIAHGSSTVRENVLTRIGDGFGEGAMPPYYGFQMDEVLRYLRALDPDRLLGGNPFHLQDALDALPAGPAPARAAADMALHDHWGKLLGLPLYRLLGLNPERAPLSSVTLSIPESADELRASIRRIAHLPILKLKLGTGNIERDSEIVREVREATAARLCVDANGAWSVQEAARIIPELRAFAVDFVEQPIAAGNHDGWHELRSLLPPGGPLIIADESIQGPQDVLALAGAADGINVKLMKTGGLRGALRLIGLARSLDMKVMLGCMIESSLAVTAAAHLAPLADFADLDGNLDLAQDPFNGASLDNGRLRLPDAPGLGATRHP
ncbi:MAG TPA: dipeptide epimerase [Rhodothermales bacterium]|nr:dipeptide epimerase [Rhodothermales bacterium]